ncbi:MAG TPA: DUF1573 domain-containing protein [Saprospiraceae bacterium]|nr:DUF1573 domain-containing protein [Saprospiraceae bacterium]HMP23326.1 DUF1573 domain-containing protein [Saprospiraceae bacterium]
MEKILAFSALLLLSMACQPKRSAEGAALQEINVGEGVADIIRNPASASGGEDTSQLAKITFVEELHDFGEVYEGDIVVHAFRFTNTGKTPLLISEARSSCGCTVPEWPQSPIAPGESGEIRARFDSNGRTGQQQKTITVLANTYPMGTSVRLSGRVLRKAE